MIITSTNLLILSISLFTYFAITAPEKCPKEYMTLKKHGGKLDNLGHIYKYCTPYHGKFQIWHLKEPND